MTSEPPRTARDVILDAAQQMAEESDMLLPTPPEPTPEQIDRLSRTPARPFTIPEGEAIL